MTKDHKTFTELWATLTPSEKDKSAIGLSRECNVRLATVSAWGRGERAPKLLSRDIITKYLQGALSIDTDSKTLFPD